MSEILKSTGVEKQVITDGDMALINVQAKTPLKPEQIYTFAVRLCDNQVDRDFERFPRSLWNVCRNWFVGNPVFSTLLDCYRTDRKALQGRVWMNPGRKPKRETPFPG